MTATTFFTIRPLERNAHHTALEGAFRVHLPDKELRAFKLSNGDIIRLSTTDGPKGFGIAWRATQTNAGKPIAKVTDLLREKYGLSLNDRLFIEKTDDDRIPLESVEISIVEPPKSVARSASTEHLLSWIRHALVDLELIHPGCTFDCQQRGPKIHQEKLRVTIESVKPSADATGPLYFDYLTSQVILTHAVDPEEELAPSKRNLQINGDGIGGLSQQIAVLNRKLAWLTNRKVELADQHLRGPTAFLIHGLEGTGKSLLLRRLAGCQWKETFRVDLASNPKAQAKDLIDTFRRAREAQPSLILMDDLDKFLAKADSLVTHLRSELEELEGTKVIVAATARSVYDVDTSLRTEMAFKFELDIFPPNVEQRGDILRKIIGPDRVVEDVNFTALAERTHGFVGRDLRKLCGLARDHRLDFIAQSSDVEEMASAGEVVHDQVFLTRHDFDAVIDQVQPTVLKDSIIEVPKVKWSDIAGLGHVQKLLEDIIIRPFKIPDLDIKFGATESRKGVLLYGPPGCAKTLIARAVATESNQNFLVVKGSELIKMYVGESERAIRDVFRRARAARPCIIFFDEIDSIAKSREHSADSGLNVVATLLNEMDGIEALKEVFIIAATNRPEILDPALMRPGRFDEHIAIDLPNEDARRQIFEIHTRKQPLAADVDLSILASKTQNKSGADIKGLCNVATAEAREDYTQNPGNKAEIRMCHFERALEHSMGKTTRLKEWKLGKS